MTRELTMDELDQIHGAARFGVRSVGQNADVEMIDLQSIVSERQNAVQVCTNIISKMQDTTNSIVQKLS